MKINLLGFTFDFLIKDKTEEPPVQYCVHCHRDHLKQTIDETYEEWCIANRHKPFAGKDGINTDEYTITRAGYVKRLSQKGDK